MKSRTISKIIVWALLGALLGILVHGSYVARGQLGRDQFLAAQGERYDKFFAHPDPVALDIIFGIIVFGILFGIYELLVFVLSKILERFENHENG